MSWERFKGFSSFADATLHVGGLTLLLGANASGKSNVRDALRFLRGIGRGYTLAEILGGKYSREPLLDDSRSNGLEADFGASTLKANELSDHGRKIGQALQEAVAEAIAEHRRLGRPIIVSREGRPASVNPNTVRTVQDRGTPYGDHPDEPG